MSTSGTPRDENMIAALKRERATYVAAGQEDRVAAVDEQLQHYGYTGQQDPGAGDEPKGRTGKDNRQRTATTTRGAQTPAADSTDGAKGNGAAKPSAGATSKS